MSTITRLTFALAGLAFFSACGSPLSRDLLAVSGGARGMVVSTFQPPDGRLGGEYAYATLTRGGVSPIAIVVEGLPPGLRFESNAILGVPTQAGTFLLTRQARDAAGAHDVAQAQITILSSESVSEVVTPREIAPVTLRSCEVPESASATASQNAINYAVGQWHPCSLGAPIVHQTYRDLLMHADTAPRFAIAATDEPLAYSVFLGQTLLVSGTLAQTSAGQTFSLSEEWLGVSFAAWGDRELVTVRVRELEVVYAISFLPTPLYVAEAPQLVHPGFRTFAYSAESIDAIFAADTDSIFIAAGRELRNVSDSAVRVSLKADPAMFATSIERQRIAAYLKGTTPRSAHIMWYYNHQTCPDTAVYYQAPAGQNPPCQYVPGGICPPGTSSERSYVCAPLTAMSLEVRPRTESSYQYQAFSIETEDMAPHEERLSTADTPAIVGVWHDVAASAPATFTDGVQDARLGAAARELVVPARSSVWIGFGITTPTVKTAPARMLTFTTSTGAAASYEERVTCTHSTKIFDRYAAHIPIQTILQARRHVEVEKQLSIALTGAVLGEVMGSETRPLFGSGAREIFEYSAEATHEGSALTLSLPVEYCP